MANTSSTVVPQAEEAHAGPRHISPVLVFVILTILTVIEIAITLFHLPKSFLIPALLAMSFAKAALVAAYYMHLRYEKIMYSIIFVTPALFAIFLIFVLAASY
jgi:cytochrome c oxidase subunit 4